MADDRGPLIDGVSWGLVSLSGTVLGLRVYAKLSRHRGLWWDDYISLVSWAIQLICVILISINISHGFGKHASELKLTYPQVVQTSLRGAVNGSLLILGAVWSKSSFAVTLLRMTNGCLKWTIIVVMATMNAFLIASIFVNVFSCNPPNKTYDPLTPGVCWHENIHIAVDVAASAYSAACDLFFALVPWLVLVNLQMKFKEKIGVGVAMSLGVFAAATGIVKTIKLENLRNEDFSCKRFCGFSFPAQRFDTNPNPFSDNGGDLQIWSIVEISMTLIAASIPVLRPFLRDAISSAGRYISADASDVRTDPYGRSRSRRKSQGTTSTNTHTNPPLLRDPSVRRPSRSYYQSQQGGGMRRAGTGDLESGMESGNGEDASDMSAELRRITNSDTRGVAFNPTPSLGLELQDMSKKIKGGTWLEY
ncbi:hypothetical protein PG996_012403 [Apiospora saccharicola]|uniref:Rhodopsin domain-containing protein n=1 Tax=Apiospora saccharicola TaxID=335842 RepID=A0ABR1U2G9_9PEZI